MSQWTELAPGIRVEQRGRRKPITWITHQGQTLNAHQWGQRLGLDSQVILFRLRHGRTIPEALDPVKLGYQRSARVFEWPPVLPQGMLPELAACMGLIDADEYLDCYREPRRAWGTDGRKTYTETCPQCGVTVKRGGWLKGHLRRAHSVAAAAIGPSLVVMLALSGWLTGWQMRHGHTCLDERQRIASHFGRVWIVSWCAKYGERR